MDFHTFTTNREACSKTGLVNDVDRFHALAFEEAQARASSQFYHQLRSEHTWEPSPQALLQRLTQHRAHADQAEPGPRFRTDPAPPCRRCVSDCPSSTTRWRFSGRISPSRSAASCCPRLTVEQSLASLGKGITAEDSGQIPETLIDDCVRLCCSLCLLENDPSVIEPDVLSKDRDKFEASGDPKYVDRAHRRGKIGWNVGRRIEVAPHYRRRHMALVWTGRGRAVPRVVPRKGSVVHRELVEKVPSGFGG